MASYEEEKAAAKAKKERQKIGVLKQKCVKYFWGSQIIRFEKKCFGWHYVGRDVDVNTEYTVDYDAGKVKKNTKIIKYAFLQDQKYGKRTSYLA